MCKNAIQYFTEAGYRYWCITLRFGKEDASTSKLPSTAYDARVDIIAALVKIREHASAAGGGGKPYDVAHCIGSLALACGLLGGTVPASWISGIAASQILLHPVLTHLNRWKARSPLIGIYRMLVGNRYSCISGRDDNLIQTYLNQILRVHPQASGKEICSSVTCRRSHLAFSGLWNHRNLSAATHDRLHEVFGDVHTVCLQNLASMGLKQTVTDNTGRDQVTEQNLLA